MILTVSNDKFCANSLSDMFRRMGIPSCSATPQAAKRELRTFISAVLIYEPDNIPGIDKLIDHIRLYGIPTFSYSENPPCSTDVFSACFTKKHSSAAIVREMAAIAYESSLKAPGIYMISGIDVGCNTTSAVFADKPLGLTKKEALILRALCRSYPEPLSKDDIIKYAFEKGLTPSPACVRTHISSLNRKMGLCKGCPRIIFVPSKGYLVETPQIIAQRKETCDKAL